MTPIYVDRQSAASLLSISDSTLEKLVRIGEFPRPRQLSGQRVGWLYREIMEWAESRPVSELAPPPNTGGRKRRDA